MEIEKSVEYMQLKAIFDELFDRVAQRIEVAPKIQKPKTEKQIDFDELFDRVAQRIEVAPKIQKPKTEKQIDNMRKKVLMEKLMKSKE
jgi:endonuclease III